MDDYAYLNTRIHAFKAGLLDPKAYADLMNLPGIPSFREYLGKTVYEKSLESASADLTLNMLEASVREEWRRTVNRVYDMTDGGPRSHLQVLTAMWEGENLKAILRGKVHHFGEEEIFSVLLPVGSLNGPALRELVRQPSARGVIDMLVRWRSPYGHPLKSALKKDPDLKRPDLLEKSLDRFILEETVRNVPGEGRHGGTIGRLAGLMVDKLNLLTAFKALRERESGSFDPSSYFIRGGIHLKLKVFQKLTGARDFNDFIEMIRLTPYFSAVSGMIPEGGVFPALGMEVGLNRFIFRQARKMAIDDPLGPGLMAGYLMQKYFEIHNLGTIFRTKSYGMYDSDIRALLVV